MPIIVPVVQELAAFASGELPPPVIHQFVDYMGAAIDLNGFLTDAFIESRPIDSGQGAGSCQIVDPSDGIVRYTWALPDTETIGHYRLQLWVWNDPMTQRYASDIFAYEVYQGVGPT